MNIVLLAHSHVGSGVYDAIKGAGAKLVLAAGYTKPETRVPAPNLLADWRSEGINVAPINQGVIPPYDKWPTGDILISANWRHFIPYEYYSQFPLAVNFHGANTCIPEYRGRSPIQRQVKDGKRSYFLTMHRLEETYDTGEILAQNMCTFGIVPSEGMVYFRMMEMAYDLTTWLLENWRELTIDR